MLIESILSRNLPKIVSRIARGLLIVTLIASSALFLAEHVRTITFPYPLDYQEGPILDQVIRLSQGQNIYRPDYSQPPYVIATYPPLYLLANAPFVSIFGPANWYGRLISTVSMIASSLFVGLILYQLTGNRFASVVGAMSPVAFPYIVLWSSLFRVDCLALCLGWAGLYVIVAGQKRTSALVVGAILFIGAVYTRQTSILVAPLAALAWLWSSGSRQQAFQLVVLVAVIGLVTLVILNLATQSGFFYNIITVNANQNYSIAVLQFWASELWYVAPIFIVISLAYVVSGFRIAQPTYWLVVAYLSGALIDFILIGKAGSAENFLLELCVGFSLAGGVVIGISGQKQAASLLNSALILLIAFQIGLMVWRGRGGSYLMERVSAQNDVEKLNQLVKSTQGPILLDEYSGLMPLQGREIYIEPSDMAELYRHGKWDDQPMLAEIEQCKFPLIVFFQGWGDGTMRARWPDNLFAAVESHYQVDMNIAQNLIYRPKCST